MKRDESTESARAGLLRDFDPSEYYVGTTFGTEGYGANSRVDRGYQSGDVPDLTIEGARSYSINSSQLGHPPRGIFDDI